ncbi:MAG: hypothetical protein HRT94_05760 [Alphaproteobacteria bacterium]|nr:hypothetical protein [Alphaproteobacteria bacterium]
MIYVFIMAIFAIMYAVKGGSGNVLKNWNEVRHRNKVFETLMDGKILSTIMAFVFGLIATADLTLLKNADGVPEYALNVLPAALFALGWLLSVAPSMGEEHGAVGRIGKAWGGYLDRGFDRDYGIKKAIQRGVFIGAVMALVTGYIPYICFSVFFVPCIFIGQELNYRVLRKEGWTLAEPIIGAVVYGIPSALWFLSV